MYLHANAHRGNSRSCCCPPRSNSQAWGGKPGMRRNCHRCCRPRSSSRSCCPSGKPRDNGLYRSTLPSSRKSHRCNPRLRSGQCSLCHRRIPNRHQNRCKPARRKPVCRYPRHRRRCHWIRVPHQKRSRYIPSVHTSGCRNCRRCRCHRMRHYRFQKALCHSAC